MKWLLTLLFPGQPGLRASPGEAAMEDFREDGRRDGSAGDIVPCGDAGMGEDRAELASILGCIIPTDINSACKIGW